MPKVPAKPIRFNGRQALNQLLEARTQLANLLTYMDGKTGAEEIIMKAIKDPACPARSGSTGRR